MGRTTREVWAKRVERWKRSGLTAADYAAQVGVNPGSLAWWKWRLGATPTSERGLRTGRAKTAIVSAAKAATITPLTFVEMTSAVTGEGVHGEALEVVLPSTVRIHVRPGFDDATLGRLLDVLERRR